MQAQLQISQPDCIARGGIIEVKPDAAAPDELRLVPPSCVCRGAVRVKIGGTVYRALRVALASGGRLSVEDFAGAVYGDEPVCGETIRSAVFRANRVLASPGTPRRLMMDYGDVALA